MNISFLLLLLLSLLRQAPEGYKVVNDDSHAFSKLMNRPLIRGDLIPLNDEVSFPDAKGILKLVNSKGTFYIRNQEKVVNNSAVNEVWLSIKSARPAKVSPVAAGRSGMLNSNYLIRAFLKQFAQSSHPLLIIDSLMIQVSPELRTENTYSIQYLIDGKTITQKLKWKVRGAASFLIISGLRNQAHEDIVTKASLTVMSAADKQQIELGNFYVFPKDSKSLIPELREIWKSQLAASNSQESSSIILKDYLIAFYGTPDNDDFDKHILPLITR